MRIFTIMGQLFRKPTRSSGMQPRPAELTRPMKLEEVLAAMQEDLSRRRAGRVRAGREYSVNS